MGCTKTGARSVRTWATIAAYLGKHGTPEAMGSWDIGADLEWLAGEIEAAEAERNFEKKGLPNDFAGAFAKLKRRAERLGLDAYTAPSESEPSGLDMVIRAGVVTVRF